MRCAGIRRRFRAADRPHSRSQPHSADRSNVRMGALPPCAVPLLRSPVPSSFTLPAGAARNVGASSRASPTCRAVLTVTVLLRRDGALDVELGHHQ